MRYTALQRLVSEKAFLGPVDTRSRPGLAARQNTPAIDGAIYYPNCDDMNQLHTHTHTHAQCFTQNRRNRSRRPARFSEGGRRILLHNSRVYVRFLPFVSGRVHPGRLSAHSAILDARYQPRETETSTTPRLSRAKAQILDPASISDATIQMDQNAVVLFTIDRLARSPRTTVLKRGVRIGPRPVVYKINSRFRRFGYGTGQITGLTLTTLLRDPKMLGAGRRSGRGHYLA